MHHIAYEAESWAIRKALRMFRACYSQKRIMEIGSPDAIRRDISLAISFYIQQGQEVVVFQRGSVSPNIEALVQCFG